MLDTATTISTGKPDATEIGHVRFGKGPSEKDPPAGTSSTAYFTACTVLRGAGRSNASRLPGGIDGCPLEASPEVLF
jgi:hypothetical protein